MNSINLLKNRPTLLLGCTLLIFLLSGFYSPGKNSVPEISAAIERDLPGLLGMIPPGQETLFGFSNRSDFSKAKPGSILEVYSISTPDQKSHSTAMLPTGEWLAIIYVEDVPAAMLTAVQIEGKWQAVAIGAKGLAHEIHVHQKSVINNRQSMGLLRIFPLQCDILLHPDPLQPDEWMGHPLTSANMALSWLPDKNTAYPLTELLPRIQQSIDSLDF